MLIRFYYVIDVNDPEQIYVGSTQLTLQERLDTHWYSRNNKFKTKLSTYMKDKQKFDFEIFLIEEKDCTKLEQNQIEDEWIQQMGLINKCRALKDPNYNKEWNKAHPEKCLEASRQWKLKKKLLAQNIS